jgi:Ala-tRNA(Pro) deacylase
VLLNPAPLCDIRSEDEGAEVPAERVRRFLLEHGIPYKTDIHPVAYTAREAALVEHIPGDQVAKPVMLKADDRLVMAVLPGDRQVNLAKAAAALGAATSRLATEAEFSPLFPDCERGAEPPFGALYDVPMVVDTRLRGPRITFNAGTHTTSISMALADYLALTKAQVLDLTVA